MTDKLLRLCLRAYPREARERHGEVLLALARDLVDDGSPPFRQAVGLLRGGAGSWLRQGKGELGALPWLEARSRLAVPLAAALLALILVGAERSTDGLAWIGWSWAIALTGGLAALVAAALGRRVPAVTGAIVVAAVLALDGIRDVYGPGSRWAIPQGMAYVDVLAMWLPAALLLVACAGAVDRPTARVGIRRIAWALVPAAALPVLSSENVNAAESIAVFGGLAAAAALVAAGVLRRRRDPTGALVAALVLAGVAPSALWLLAGVLPAPDSGTPALALGYFAAGGLVTAGSVLLLARLSGRAESRNLHGS